MFTLIDRPKTHRVKAGQFRPVTWASAICKETGDVYRVNGKHTSTLLAGLDVLPEFYVTVEEYECETLEDVAKLYGTFDSAMQQRSARDIYLSFAGTVPQYQDVSAKIITIIPGAIASIFQGDRGYGQTAPEKAEALLENIAFATWLNSLIIDKAGGSSKPGKGGNLLKQPVVAAMFGNFNKSMKAATEFWTAVRDETGVEPNLPDRKLARYLLTTGLRRDARTARTAINNREIYVKCLHAWNAWRKGETTNLNYHAEAKIPVIQ